MGFLQSLLGAAPASSGLFRTELLGSASLDSALRNLVSEANGRGFHVLNALRRASKYLRTQHGLRMRRHIGPDGEAWPKAVFKPAQLPEPRLDKPGPIKGNSFYNLEWAKLTTDRMVDRSRALVAQLQRSRAGKTGELRVPALYRPQRYGSLSTSGELLKYKGKGRNQTKAKLPVTGVLYGMLTKDKVSGSATSIKRKAGAYELIYGLNSAASRWASVHQGGNHTFRGKPVPRRAFIGMNQSDVAHILRLFEEAKQKALAGKAGSESAMGA